MNNPIPVLELKGIQRFFGKKETQVRVLNDVNLKIYSGELVALIGPSGSGKSTLLHLAGLLDTPNNGEIYLDGRLIDARKDTVRTQLRRHFIGFVYQFHLLLPDFNALENVVMPQLIAGKRREDALKRARYLLHEVGLEHRLEHRAGALSGGEQQRVAIARALANEPRLLLADEPTGNLDPLTAGEVFETFLKLVRQTGLSAIIATHNPELAARMDRQIQVQNGVLVEL